MLELINYLIDFILNIDDHIATLIAQFGGYTYAIIFGIIFAETGLVVTPFLPGDSLIFIIGAFSAKGSLNLVISYFVLITAAIIGDSVNYEIGKYLGLKVFKEDDQAKILKKSHLDKTQDFYAKHGAKTIVIARFIPFVRTFAPFVAGAGKMHYTTFLKYNILGSFIWVTSIILAGFFLGEIPIVKNNFEYVVYGIILISILPPIFSWIKSRRQK
ncbi:MAG: DedA family protein [Mycoplasmatales bacterium]